MKGYLSAALFAASFVGTGCIAQPVENLTYTDTTVRAHKSLLVGATKAESVNRTTFAHATTHSTSSPAPTMTEFATLDVDSDGYLELAELPQDDGFRDTWLAFDTDGDSRITQVEYDAWYVADVAED